MDAEQTAKLNKTFGLGREEDGVAGEVVVDNDGWISFGTRTLTQGEAVDIAAKLVTAVQASINREQINAPNFFDSAEIVRRKDGKLGKAIVAIHNIYR